MKWYRLIAENWKTHFIPEELLEVIKHDCRTRGHRIESCELIDSVPALDTGGPCRTDRSWQTVDCGDGQFQVPTEEFEYFEMMLRTINLRYGHDKTPYFKLHGWLWCVVLTPVMRMKALGNMNEHLPEVIVQADKEFARWEERMRVRLWN